MATGEVLTHSIKLDYPIFSGEDPNGWLFKISQFVAFHNTLPQHRLTLVSFNMKGKALTWFQDLDELGVLVD